eukprot:GHRQ01012502.1.p1 GENE.GHRQ01012502.1~~GHRQ01012502.1.p1  ORF type:complete len:378 (+),score=137.39 GHRQ01012502.1:835-1968(+)
MLEALADEKLGPSVAKIFQQAYGDAVWDGAPIVMISNWHTTILLLRDTADVRNKTLQGAQWAWDSADVHPVGAFLYVLDMAHQYWQSGAKQQLQTGDVPVAPKAGYEVQLGSRQVQLGTNFNGWRPAPDRKQPPRSSKASRSPHSSNALQSCQAGGEGCAAVGSCSESGSKLSPTYSSNSSYSSSDGGAGQFDAAAWAAEAASSPAAEAIEALPCLSSSVAACSSTCLSSSSCRRVFKGKLKGVPAAFKAYSCKDYFSMSAFVAEAKAYMKLQGAWGELVPKLLALGRLPDSGVPVLVVSLGEPMDVRLLHQHAAAAAACLQRFHAAGFAHGDVRAGNFVLLDSKVVLCDLETCRPAEEEACKQDKVQLRGLLSSSF